MAERDRFVLRNTNMWLWRGQAPKLQGRLQRPREDLRLELEDLLLAESPLLWRKTVFSLDAINWLDNAHPHYERQAALLTFYWFTCYLKWSEVNWIRGSLVQLFATPWTVAHQAPPSMEFSRQEYWMDCHSLLQEIFPTQESNPGLPHCTRTPKCYLILSKKCFHRNIAKYLGTVA